MARGDEAAFQQFYEHYFDRLFRYLIVVTQGNEELAREVLQTLMIRVVRYIKHFEEETVLWGWLTRIARTTFIDILRKQKRDRFASELLNFEDSIPPHNDELLLKTLDESLLELDEDEQKLIKTAYFEKIGHQGIADTYGTTAKAIESKLARIRQKLRKNILKKTAHHKI